jgi:hypothetical protein
MEYQYVVKPEKRQNKNLVTQILVRPHLRELKIDRKVMY